MSQTGIGLYDIGLYGHSDQEFDPWREGTIGDDGEANHNEAQAPGFNLLRDGAHGDAEERNVPEAPRYHAWGVEEHENNEAEVLFRSHWQDVNVNADAPQAPGDGGGGGVDGDGADGRAQLWTWFSRVRDDLVYDTKEAIKDLNALLVALSHVWTQPLPPPLDLPPPLPYEDGLSKSRLAALHARDWIISTGEFKKFSGSRRKQAGRAVLQLLELAAGTGANIPLAGPINQCASAASRFAQVVTQAEHTLEMHVAILVELRSMMVVLADLQLEYGNDPDLLPQSLADVVALIHQFFDGLHQEANEIAQHGWATSLLNTIDGTYEKKVDLHARTMDRIRHDLDRAINRQLAMR
ncbi:hypothetical protein BDQ17DRAFT_676063 [Cyathus striatus]|nr:hypothetical protein BDQ17DRAFT_676063 [Cyathus striatus]